MANDFASLGRSSTVSAPAPAPYYCWAPEGKPVEIHVDYDVIDRLSAEILKGFAAVPKRGAEVGGILLGTVERTAKLTLHITDFDLVPCQYKRGPSYLLTNSDTAAFEASVERWRPAGLRKYAVGYFRSHTRDGLALSEEDLQLFSTYFPDPSSVILLVRPFATKVSMAGFFIEENGQIRADASYLEFPFRRKELGGPPVENPRGAAPAFESEPYREPEYTHSGSRPRFDAPLAGYLPDPSAAANAPLPPAPLAADSAPLASSIFREDSGPPTAVTLDKLKKTWVWIPLSFIFLMLGVVVGFQVAMSANRSPEPGGPAIQLALQVQKQPNALHVSWNRGSGPIQKAIRGVLHITEGSYYKAVQLSPKDLRTGSVIVHQVSNNISFRLEVFMADRTSVSETVDPQTVR
jgi:hypothetical protein